MNSLNQAAINAEASALKIIEAGDQRQDHIEELAAEVVDDELTLQFDSNNQVNIITVAQQLLMTDEGRDVMYEAACKLIEANYESISRNIEEQAAANAAQ